MRRSPWNLSTLSDRARVRMIGRRLFQYRFAKFTEMLQYLTHFSALEDVEGRRLILQVALALLLLAKDIEECFQKLGVLGHDSGFLSHEMFQIQLMGYLLGKLDDTEVCLVAMRMTRERPEQPSSGNDSDATEAVDSHFPPRNQNCCQQQQQQQQQPSQQQNDEQEHQQRSGDPAEPELHGQRIRQYQRTIQQLQELHLNNPDDLGGKLMHMHVALALLHLLEWDSSWARQGSSSDFSVQHVRALKATVLNEIYLCELQMTGNEIS
ncbi:hypothetical protein ACOMHN_061298 [Nucella lapillus]